MCVDVSICSVSVSLSLAQEVENWWVLDGENCFKTLKVMQDSHTTSTCTSLCEKLLNIALSVLVYYEVGKQWDIIKLLVRDKHVVGNPPLHIGACQYFLRWGTAT